MDEFEIIERIVARLGDVAVGPGVIVGPGDDAAVLEIPGDQQLVVSTDTLVAGRHYPDGACAAAIGYRSLAVATSDLAAMGATPGYATVSLVAEGLTADWAERYASGLAQAAQAFGIAIVGGNIARGVESITVTVHGYVPNGAAMTRGGARHGDRVYVTGSLGGAALALGEENLADWSLIAKPESRLDAPGDESPLQRYWMPQPRLELGIALRGIASAAIDISDGLSSDLEHLCRASGVGCEVELNELPVYPGAAPFDAVAMGDDYELAFTASPEADGAVETIARRLGVAVTPIGILRKDAGPGATWLRDGLRIDVRPGYRHF